MDMFNNGSLNSSSNYGSDQKINYTNFDSIDSQEGEGFWKKNKKMIAIVVATILVVGVVVVVLLFLGRRIDLGGFNKFANYVLFETDSSEKITEEYDYRKKYALEEWLSSTVVDSQSDKVKRVIELWNGFSKNDIKKKYESTVDQLQEYIDFMNRYANFPLPSIYELSADIRGLNKDGSEGDVLANYIAIFNTSVTDRQYAVLFGYYYGAIYDLVQQGVDEEVIRKDELVEAYREQINGFLVSIARKTIKLCFDLEESLSNDKV